MKKALWVNFFIGLFLAITIICSAEELKPVGESIFDIKFKAGYYSKYLALVSGVTLYNHPVFQQSATLLHKPSGVYVSSWVSYSPKKKFNANAGDEIDGTIGIVRKIGPIEFDFCYSYLNFINLKSSIGDIHNLALRTTFPKLSVFIPYLIAEYNSMIKYRELNGAAYRAGLISDFKFFAVDASISGHSGLFGAKPNLINAAKLTIFSEFKIYKNIILAPEISAQKNLGKDIKRGGLNEDKFWYGLTLTAPL